MRAPRAPQPVAAGQRDHTQKMRNFTSFRLSIVTSLRDTARPLGMKFENFNVIFDHEHSGIFKNFNYPLIQNCPRYPINWLKNLKYPPIKTSKIHGIVPNYEALTIYYIV